MKKTIINFEEFIKKNKDKIYSNTPKNPKISKDDEWAKETEWDKLFEELKEN